MEENIVILLHVINHSDRFVKVKNKLQHSTETLQTYFHEVLNEMEFAKEVIIPTSVDQNTNVSRIKELLKKFQYNHANKNLHL